MIFPVYFLGISSVRKVTSGRGFYKSVQLDLVFMDDHVR